MATTCATLGERGKSIFLNKTTVCRSPIPSILAMDRQEAQVLQNRSLLEAQYRCEKQLLAEPPVEGGDYCPGTWDDIMCWPTTPSGTVARQPCPEYISNFNTAEFAVKECLSNGTWYHRPSSDHPFTNYSRCPLGIPMDLLTHMPKIRLMYKIGYGISLTTLFIAVLIMLFCR
ncbi:calcitonin receptor-like [Liolophura sinensis]|uniref:calcitonin receptor-like n=1 Tax=Liolophura sinensis TaxID=3198878 RepID=UPI003158FDA2